MKEIKRVPVFLKHSVYTKTVSMRFIAVYVYCVHTMQV